MTDLCGCTSYHCRFGARFQCYKCRLDDGIARHAVVRIFSGREGSGFPACAEHINAATTRALAPLLQTTHPIDHWYTVRAIDVLTLEDGFPYLGRVRWTAWRHGRARDTVPG